MLLILMCFSWFRTLLLLSSMKMYDNPFIILLSRSLEEGHLVREPDRSNKAVGGNPSCATNSPMDRSGLLKGKLQHRSCG
jgi:hypothetical protein